MYPGSLVVAEATLLEIERSMGVTNPRRQWPSAGLVAIADLGLLVNLRMRRRRRSEKERVARSLQLAVRRGNLKLAP